MERNDRTDSERVLGLVAGGGRFPFEVAQAARRRGMRVVCIGIHGEVSPELAQEVDAFRTLGLGRLGAALRYLRRHGVREVSWAGWIRKERFFRPWALLIHRPDWRAIRLWFFRLRRLDRQSQTILAAAAAEFEREGFHLAHSTHHCPDLLVEEGVLTKRLPTRRELEDIVFGWRVAQRMADLDVGQSVIVCDKATIAVEGIEGTDRNILRAGEFCGRGFTVVKLAREHHDMRFDVPTVGPRTIETMVAARGKVLAIEAGRTIVLERERTVELANRAGIVVIALRDAPVLEE
ncbi:MAG TPA: UDP-2,3-diacylglucosamine diphosphatase LpxI [Planctomycetota bacterium]|nr:UDP-2,3-diacylglucosamine diphosphatase LpxI [Planctomycetota bacterium]